MPFAPKELEEFEIQWGFWLSNVTYTLNTHFKNKENCYLEIIHSVDRRNRKFLKLPINKHYFTKGELMVAAKKYFATKERGAQGAQWLSILVPHG